MERSGGRVIAKVQDKISSMKRILVVTVLLGAFACQNPEDKATHTNDTTLEYQEGRTLNSPPGANSPDTTATPRMDSTLK